MDTLFSNNFCPKSKKCYNSKSDSKHYSKCNKKDDKHHECKCEKDDHDSKWCKKDGEWKYVVVNCNCECGKEDYHSKCDNHDKPEDPHCDKKHHEPKEHDCVYSILKELADDNNSMMSPTRPAVHLHMKGTTEFVYLRTGALGPTPFTLMSFNHKTGCAKFTYESVIDRSPLVYMVDASSLAAISIAQV
ncbi:hypothetical protein [Pseudalkalibacillus hwajinpoensis]|uniref:hypothetical protein n=2 Tax=Guptibacillus hwajinpoensis TaxID=208199 RepID=UPI00385071A2